MNLKFKNFIFFLNLFLKSKDTFYLLEEIENFVKEETEFSTGSELTFLQIYKFFVVYAIINEKSSLYSVSRHSFNKYLRFLLLGECKEDDAIEYSRKYDFEYQIIQRPKWVVKNIRFKEKLLKSNYFVYTYIRVFGLDSQIGK